jgi:membrane associated rhomboid family serine protease
MKPLVSGPAPAITLGQAVTRLPRRWPIATMSVLTVTAVVTALQFPFPAVRLALWRDPAALAAGQWWRLVTALFVQYDPWWQIIIVFALIAGIGVIAERLFGPGRWLLLYLGCGVVGQAFGFRWQPYDAGASVAGAGLLGAVCAWLLSPAGPPLARVRIWGAAWPLAGLVLTAVGDVHGPPLLLGFALGALLLWRDRRGYPGGPRSRRDRGLTALIEGLFGFVWFGWAQANASAGLRDWLAVAGVAAALVALAGGVQAFRGPASAGVLHDRRARRRYGIAIGVEFTLAGVGAAVLAVAGQSDFIPVWVCAVVGVHFFPLASLLQDRQLVALGASVATVALVALVAEPAGVAPSTVTGIGAGTLLTGFALAALAGGHAEEMSRLRSTDRPV